MKIRSGFVSNSSSASFFLTWSDTTLADLDKSLKNLFIDDEEYKQNKDLIKDIKRKTTQVAPGSFNITGFTVIWNGDIKEDFGEDIDFLINKLEENNGNIFNYKFDVYNDGN